MDRIPDARTFPDATVERMVQVVDPAWELETAVPVERGFCSVYRLVVADGETRRELYLKASPDGRRWGIPDEARLQAVLDEHTSIPVPTVLGVVDDHDEFPAPFYLMAALPGEALPYEEVCRLDDDRLRRLARETGEYLGQLHSVPAVDGFGHVRHDGPGLTGDRPAGTTDSLTVGDPRETWPTFLREYAERELDRHADSRFSELTAAITRWFESRVDALEGPFEPVLGRNDHGLHNLLVDPASGAIEGMLDWGYTLAVPASFDVEFAVYVLGGAYLAGLPDVEDRRSLVRTALLSGYREAAPDRIGAVSIPEPCYELLAAVRITNDFGSLTVPDGADGDVADHVRADVRTFLDRDPTDP